MTTSVEEMVAKAIYDECRIIEQENNGGEIRSPFATLSAKERNEMCRLAGAAIAALQPMLVAALAPFGEVDGEGDEEFPDATPVTVQFGR